MRKLSVCALTTLCLMSTLVSAQKLTQQQKSSIDEMIYQEIKKENTVKFARKTTENILSSCDLEYKYAYRDFNAKRGAPIYVQGAVSLSYSKGKNPGILFKVAPAVGDANTSNWEIVYPPYAELFLNNVSLKKYQAADFVCENNGKCIVYIDKDMSLLTQIFSKDSTDMTIKFSLSKGGNDNTIRFKDLLSAQQYLLVKDRFNSCGMELLDMIIKDLSPR